MIGMVNRGGISTEFVAGIIVEHESSVGRGSESLQSHPHIVELGAERTTNVVLFPDRLRRGGG